MDFQTILTWKMADAYQGADQLMALCSDDQLDWTPATGTNWMSLGQLILHMSQSCGHGMRGFITGDWGLPPDMDMGAMDLAAMLPSAEQMPSATSVVEARTALSEDRALAEQQLVGLGEVDLLTREAVAPWLPDQRRTLGFQLLSMVDHLTSHKQQLFHYLKLQGRPMHTGLLWGSAP